MLQGEFKESKKKERKPTKTFCLEFLEEKTIYFYILKKFHLKLLKEQLMLLDEPIIFLK